MATLREKIDYAKQNPESDFAKRLYFFIQKGDADIDASNEGIDLSGFGRQTQVRPEIPIAPKKGIIQTEIEETGKKLAESYAGQDTTAGKIAVAATAPLRTVGAGARIVGKIIAKPIEGFIKMASEALGENKTLQRFAMSETGEDISGGAATVAGAIQGALDEAKRTLTPEVYQSLADSAEIALLALGVKPAKEAAKVGLDVAGQAAKEAAETGAQAGKQVVEAIAKPIKAGTKTVTTLPSKAKSWVQKPIPPNVETMLKETPTETFDKYVKFAQDAVKNTKSKTPLEQAGIRAQGALDQIQRKLNTIGKNKGAQLDKAAVGNKPVGNIVVKFRQDLQKALSGKTQVEGNQKVFKDILSEAEKLGNNPTAKQVDQFIDFVQDRIYTGKRDLSVPVTDDVENILRPITGKLNEGLKTNLPDSYRTLNQQYSDLVKVRNELNLKLGAEGEKGGALMKRVFSPSDANTKELFARVLDETGIDLVNEATLARYMMDVLGDARQKSMLEQLNLSITKPTPSGLANRLVDYLIEKANTPEEMIRRARELTSGGGATNP